MVPASCCMLGAQLLSWPLSGAAVDVRGMLQGAGSRSLAVLLKPNARCQLLNRVFPWVDFYLHLKGMLIVQMCKQSPSNSIKGSRLL